ncbi:DUF6232 family protein [Muricauda sp. ANG21]|uniref:DUF6232 family protein n=1 Tax=Allomuricauda sp. ANG21 TaxID=3042468 RepID=UPI003453A0D6
MENEKIFFRDTNVLVTQSRVVIFNKTYSLGNVSSVDMLVKHKTGTKFFSLSLLIIGLLGIFNEVYGLGVFSIAIAALLFFFMKDEFIVRISSNSGENNALISKNKDYVQQVVNAISEAIIYRG